MKNNASKRQVSSGEAIIKRAFRRSLISIVLLGISGALVYLWLRPASVPTQIDEAKVEAPAPPDTRQAGTPPAVHFTDVTQQAGIDFKHINGAYGERLMPETIGSGAAFIDYDNDGDQDLFLVNSNDWPDHETGEVAPTQALYQNDGRGYFQDVTQAAGLAFSTFGMGVAVGDYDNDGWTDLFVTAAGRDHLFHNQRGVFREVTEAAGVAGTESDWSSSAAFVDYDNDGDLDLFVGRYVKWSRDIDLEIDFRLTGLGRAYGAPDHFLGSHSVLYRNDGDGRFSDVSAAAGIQVTDPGSGLPVGKALGVRLADYDRDGWIDILVANDTTRNFLFHNLGNGAFEEIAMFEGIAFDRDGKATSGMGIDAAYFRNDLSLGVVIGNFSNEMSSLYVLDDGRPPFADEAVLEGVGAPSRLVLTFGVLFLDYDLDGNLDLLQANGHLEHEINKVQPSQQYAQPPLLLWNCGPGCDRRFVPVQDAGDLDRPLVGRGASYADIDADGDLDLLITQNGRRPALLRNDQALGHHWLRVQLLGRKANRSAIGARVELQVGGITQHKELAPVRGFMGQVEMPLTFGLGSHTEIESLVVHWPGGGRQEVAVAEVDRILIVEQTP